MLTLCRLLQLIWIACCLKRPIQTQSRWWQQREVEVIKMANPQWDGRIDGSSPPALSPGFHNKSRGEWNERTPRTKCTFETVSHCFYRASRLSWWVHFQLGAVTKPEGTIARHTVVMILDPVLTAVTMVSMVRLFISLVDPVDALHALTVH